MTTSQQRDLYGLKALVTGATAGLGRAIAFQLARDGAHVTVHGRDAGRGVQTVEEIQLQGGTARFVAADLADATSVARFAKEVGDIDILVNNAGFSVWGPTETFEIASFDTMFAANVRAPFPRLRVRARHGGPWNREHYQHQQHGRTPRSRWRRGVWGHQSGAGFIHPGMGGGVQLTRRQGQCCRARPDLHATRGAGTLRLARGHHSDEACGRPSGDRGGRGIPGLATCQLYDRSYRRRRRWPNRDLGVREESWP
jgi:hypothetical protein